MATQMNPDPAGGGTVIAEEVDDIFPIPMQLVCGAGGGTLFLMKVHGDAMAPKIVDGDWTIVRQQPDADDGAIVTALYDSEGVFRLLRKEAGRTYLVALNEEAGLPDIMVGDGDDEAIIMGVVTTVLHTF